MKLHKSLAFPVFQAKSCLLHSVNGIVMNVINCRNANETTKANKMAEAIVALDPFYHW